MHFYEHGGKHRVLDNHLVLGCYLHDDWDGKKEWSVNSIQSAKLLPNHQLMEFLQCLKYVFYPKLPNDLEVERWYHVTIKFTDYEAHDFEIVSIKDVTDSKIHTDKVH